MTHNHPSFPTPETPARPIPESYWVIENRLLAGEYPSSPYQPEISRLRLQAFLRTGFNTFFDLTAPGEIEVYLPALNEAAAALGREISYRRFAIGDYGLPSREQMRATLNALDEALAAGRKIYLHCQGGIGRTGTTVGCYLAQHGLSGEAALTELARRWQKVPKSAQHPHSPETLEQENFVRNWQPGL
ncbi:MAG: protein-tyrosine phosphatase family protein [Anaerolineales bacterium]